MNVSSWGRLSSDSHDAHFINNRLDFKLEGGIKSHLAYGMGRSYGDVCLNPEGQLLVTKEMDRFISFDESSGVLVCESGVLIKDVNRLSMPRGWMLPVTPGTQLITIGGALANDVHGKNHTRYGTFGNHVRKITLKRTDGELIECSREVNSGLFFATVGGIGLTGIILTVEIQLYPSSSPWLTSEKISYGSVSEFFQLAKASESDWEHTVSWFDCQSGGRGIFTRGNYVKESTYLQSPKSSRKKVPAIPISLVNNLSVTLFNKIYYASARYSSGKHIEHYENFLYPLDGVENWNNIYGPRGFYQYQCVLPRDTGEDGIKCLLKEISKSGLGSFLSVLKTFGDIDSVGILSFAQPGVTLALDFLNRSPDVELLFERLDKVVLEARGRLYLAKDARMAKAFFEATYPKIDNFLAYRDPGISSSMSRRLLGM